MRILVTGAGGYIGSMLCDELLANGHRVTALDLYNHPSPTMAPLCAWPEFEPIRGDARDEATLKNLLKKVDIIVSLAAVVGAPACDRDQTAAITTNRDSVALLCHLASPDQLVIYPNTNSGYGFRPGMTCTENMPLSPVSLYGRTKCEAEDIVMQRENAIVFRLATVFGCSPRMRVDLLVNDLVHRAVSDRALVVFEGHFMRNYVHVRDVAAAFLHAIRQRDSMKGEIYNVGNTAANMSKLQLAERIKHHLPDTAILESQDFADPDKRDYQVSNEKIEQAGWTPMFSIDHGIQELIKFYRTVSVKRFANV